MAASLMLQKMIARLLSGAYGLYPFWLVSGFVFPFKDSPHHVPFFLSKVSECSLAEFCRIVGVMWDGVDFLCVPFRGGCFQVQLLKVWPSPRQAVPCEWPCREAPTGGKPAPRRTNSTSTVSHFIQFTQSQLFDRTLSKPFMAPAPARLEFRPKSSAKRCAIGNCASSLGSPAVLQP